MLCSNTHTVLVCHSLLFIQCLIYSGSNNNDCNNTSFSYIKSPKRDCDQEENNVTERMEEIYCISENFCFKVTKKSKLKVVQFLFLKSRLTMKFDFGLVFGHLPSTDTKKTLLTNTFDARRDGHANIHSLYFSVAKTSSQHHTYVFYTQQHSYLPD